MPLTPEQRYDRAMFKASTQHEQAIRVFQEGRADSILSRYEIERCALIEELRRAYKAGRRRETQRAETWKRKIDVCG